MLEEPHRTRLSSLPRRAQRAGVHFPTSFWDALLGCVLMSKRYPSFFPFSVEINSFTLSHLTFASGSLLVSPHLLQTNIEITNPISVSVATIAISKFVNDFPVPIISKWENITIDVYKSQLTYATLGSALCDQRVSYFDKETLRFTQGDIN
jgi:hypothetical protein